MTAHVAGTSQEVRPNREKGYDIAPPVCPAPVSGHRRRDRECRLYAGVETPTPPSRGKTRAPLEDPP